jgi:hypothetical protein
MNVDANTLTLISACTALAASIAGPSVQLLIARRQINANVVSVNRQKWIESLRDLVAEMISLLNTGAYVKLALHRKAEDITPGNVRMLEKIERIMLVKNKIRLLVNPADKDQRALLAAIETPFARLWQQEEHDVVAAVSADIDEIAKHTQVILRREWLRVKRGE